MPPYRTGHVFGGPFDRDSSDGSLCRLQIMQRNQSRYFIADTFLLCPSCTHTQYTIYSIPAVLCDIRTQIIYPIQILCGDTHTGPPGRSTESSAGRRTAGHGSCSTRARCRTHKQRATSNQPVSGLPTAPGRRGGFRAGPRFALVPHKIAFVGFAFQS